MTSSRTSHTEAIGAKLTPALNARFRAACARLGMSLNQALVQAITAWLEKVDGP
jgi:hypothetical protein